MVQDFTAVVRGAWDQSRSSWSPADAQLYSCPPPKFTSDEDNIGTKETLVWGVVGGVQRNPQLPGLKAFLVFNLVGIEDNDSRECWFLFSLSSPRITHLVHGGALTSSFEHYVAITREHEGDTWSWFFLECVLTLTQNAKGKRGLRQFSWLHMWGWSNLSKLVQIAWNSQAKYCFSAWFNNTV